MENNSVAGRLPKQSPFIRFLSLGWIKRSTVVEIISSLLIILFVYAALSKLLDYEKFKFQLGRSPYIANVAGNVAWGLPLVELIISLLLVFKKTRLVGLYSSFFMMLLFTGYIYAMLHYSYFVPCSCGGILSKMSWTQHFYFNIIFTLLSLIGVLIHKRASNY